MTCKFCDSKLEKEEINSINWICKNCNVLYNKEDGYKAGYFKERDIDGVTYVVVFFYTARRTVLYKENVIICSFSGEISFNDLFKRVKTIKVFS